LLNLIFKELCFSRASSAQAGHYTRPASFGKAFTTFFEKNLKLKCQLFLAISKVLARLAFPPSYSRKNLAQPGRF